MPSGRVTVLCVIGTRPEAIKMAPVIVALRHEPWAVVRVLATAQHREMLDQVLGAFGVVPDVDLDIMEPNQTLPALTARLLLSLDESVAREQPDLVLAQGDTTTVLATALGVLLSPGAVRPRRGWTADPRLRQSLSRGDESGSSPVA